jgi:CRP-like cAMP-binding protein
MNRKKDLTKEKLLSFLQLCNSIHPVSKGAEQYLLKTMYCRNIPKGQYLVRSGEICDSMVFITRGVMRSFLIEDGKEITTRFGMENELVTTLDSFIMNVPTVENIQAVEDCEMLVISSADLNKLYKKCPSFNAVGRRLMELYYIYAEKRAYITRMHDAEKKYELFLQYFSAFSNRIQLTYIASFLGITLETLSRVRAKVSSRRKKNRAD